MKQRVVSSPEENRHKSWT